jgi:hypothetical protein
MVQYVCLSAKYAMYQNVETRCDGQTFEAKLL